MKKTVAFMLALPLALVLVGAALAVELWTPPLRNQGDVLGCEALNIGSSAVQVTAEIIENGSVVASGTLVVAPLSSRLITYTSSTVYGATCKFTFNGSKKKVRGVATIEDMGGSTTRLIVEAR